MSDYWRGIWTGLFAAAVLGFVYLGVRGFALYVL
jgi:hypothetical protein